uniref:PBPe domain-containing protein n=1 Tax=Steinernema glaseri TaxID=37863 RepID=A0A1I7Y600_9BILA
MTIAQVLAEDFAFELNRNTSVGMVPTEREFWEADNSAQKYCEWLLDKMTDPGWIEEEDFTTTWVLYLLLLTVVMCVAAAVGFNLGLRRTRGGTKAQEMLPTFVNPSFNHQASVIHP